MDINHIECFLNVAQTLNFSEAARRGYISQSMVSRYIGKLESELGARLFIRSNKEVMLSHEGKVFLPYAASIADSMEKAKFAINQLHSGYSGRLRIVCDFGADSFAADCIRDFNLKYPGIAVEISQLHGEEVRLVDGSCDFAFVLRDMVPDSTSIKSCVTHEDRLCIIRNRRVSNKEKRLVLLSESENPILYMEIMEVFHAKRIIPNIAARPNNIRSLRIAVMAGMGDTLLPSSAAADFTGEGMECEELSDIDTTLVYAAAWNKNSANPAADLFLEIVKSYAGGYEDEY